VVVAITDVEVLRVSATLAVDRAAAGTVDVPDPVVDVAWMRSGCAEADWGVIRTAVKKKAVVQHALAKQMVVKLASLKQRKLRTRRERVDKCCTLAEENMWLLFHNFRRISRNSSDSDRFSFRFDLFGWAFVDFERWAALGLRCSSGCVAKEVRRFSRFFVECRR
jgi:hypothetical protein